MNENNFKNNSNANNMPTKEKDTKKNVKIIIAVVLALLAVIIAIVIAASKTEPTTNTGSNNVIDSTNSTEDVENNGSEDVNTPENGDSENNTNDETDIPVAPDNNDDETGDGDDINKDDAEKFPTEDGDKEPVVKPTPTDKPNEGDDNNNQGSDDKDDPTVTPNPTDKPDKEPTVKPTPTDKPDEGDKNDPTVTPKPTDKPDKEPTVKPTPTDKPTVTPGVSSDVLWEGKEYPENEAGYGPENGTINLGNIGTKIPTLPEFNNYGVDTGDKGWIGDKIDEEQFFVDVLDDVRYTMIRNGVIGNTTQAFLYGNYNIGFSWTMGGGADDIELSRDPDSNIYTLTIRTNLKSEYSNLMKMDLAPYNRDLVKVFLSLVSSTPNELYDAVYDTIYGDDDMPISLNSWGSIDGVDCLGRINYAACQKGQYVFEFKAK